MNPANLVNPANPVNPGLLAAIVAATRRIVDVRSEREPLTQLRARVERVVADDRTPRRSLLDALSRPGRVNVIAECKRRSPSKGVLRADYDPAAIAAEYAAAGAAAVSVLTEPTFFDAALEHLAAVHAAIDIPLLRKDFIVSEHQILEARDAAASALLLIVAPLSPADLEPL